MTKLILLDAYAIIYRSYYALLRTPRINSKGLNTSAIMGFCNTLHEVLTKEQPDYIGVAFDHGKTFRHESIPPIRHRDKKLPRTSSALYLSFKISSALYVFPYYRRMASKPMT